MMPEQPAATSKDWVAALFIAVLVNLFYAPSIRNGFVYDDHDLILEQPQPQSLADIPAVFTEPHPHYGSRSPYYRPLALLSYRLQKLMHGNNPLPYHLLNNILVSIVAVSLFALLRQPCLNTPMPLAFVGSLLFSVHPNVSSCVYAIANRETLLPLLFMLLALITFLRGGIAYWILSLVCLFAALLTKEQAIVLPLILVLADVLRQPGHRLDRRARFIYYAALLLVLITYVTVRTTVVGGHRPELALPSNPMGPLWSLAYALQTTFVPFSQLMYEPPRDVWLDVTRLAVALAVTFVIIFFAIHNKEKHGGPALLFSSMFLLGVVPTSNIFLQETMFAERYVATSLASIVVLLVLIAGIFWPRRIAGAGIMVAACVLVMLSGYVSWNRADDYADDIAFGTQWIATNPRSLNGHKLLGRSYLEAENTSAALNHFDEALRLDDFQADAHFYAGFLRQEIGDSHSAENHLRRSVELDPGKAASWYELASIELSMDKQGDAIVHLTKTVQLAPHYAEAHMQLGNLLARTKDYEGAAYHYEKAMIHGSASPEAYNNLGNALLQLKQYDKARFYIERAIMIEPGYTTAHYNLAQVFAQLGDRSRAIDELLRCIQIAEAWRNDLDLVLQLIRLYDESGEPAETTTWLKHAIVLTEKDRPKLNAQLRTRLKKVVDTR